MLPLWLVCLIVVFVVWCLRDDARAAERRVSQQLEDIQQQQRLLALEQECRATCARLAFPLPPSLARAPVAPNTFWQAAADWAMEPLTAPCIPAWQPRPPKLEPPPHDPDDELFSASGLLLPPGPDPAPPSQRPGARR